MAGQTQTVLQSLVAQGLTNNVSADGTPSFKPVVYIGRGVPDAWITPGQTISVNNLTSDFNETTGQRQTYGVTISTSTEGGTTAVHVQLSGQAPGKDMEIQLPAYADEGVRSVSSGKYIASTQTSDNERQLDDHPAGQCRQANRRRIGGQHRAGHPHPAGADLRRGDEGDGRRSRTTEAAR